MIPPPTVILAIELQSRYLRSAEILALLKIRTDRDVRDRILHAIVEVRRTHDDVASRLQIHSDFPALQMLRTQLIIGARRHSADRELPVELVQRRRTEAETVIAPDAHRAGDVIHRRRARADDRVGAIVQAGGRRQRR